MHTLTLDKVATFVGGKCIGDGKVEVSGISSLDKAASDQLTFLFDPRYKPFLAKTKAACVLITNDLLDECPVNSIVVTNPYVAYAIVSKQFETAPKPVVGIHASAVISNDVKIDQSISVGPNVAIYPGVTLGQNVVIGANCVIRDNVSIGDDSVLQDNISLYHGVQIGNRVKIHSGVVIGSDGFGIAKDKGVWRKIAQLGIVIINDDVEIGANTTIDRGAMENTIIGQGVQLDNQIQIGHNVTIDTNTAVAGCVGIAGSTKIGKDCLIGGGVGIAGHYSIADNVTLTAFTGVKKSIKKSGVYSSGIGCIEIQKWRKVEARLIRLDKYMQSLLSLENKVKNLEVKDEN